MSRIVLRKPIDLLVFYDRKRAAAVKTAAALLFGNFTKGSGFLRDQQADVAVLPQIDDAHFARLRILEDVEGMAEKVELLGGFSAVMGVRRKVLVLTTCASGSSSSRKKSCFSTKASFFSLDSSLDLCL